MSDPRASVSAHAERTNAAVAAGAEATQAGGEAAEPTAAGWRPDDPVAGLAPDGGNVAGVRAAAHELAPGGPRTRRPEGVARVRLLVQEGRARRGRGRGGDPDHGSQAGRGTADDAHGGEPAERGAPASESAALWRRSSPRHERRGCARRRWATRQSAQPRVGRGHGKANRQERACRMVTGCDSVAGPAMSEGSARVFL